MAFYVFLPRGAETEFVDHCRHQFSKRYPDIDGPDFTSIIDQRSSDRPRAEFEDGRAQGRNANQALCPRRAFRVRSTSQHTFGESRSAYVRNLVHTGCS